MPSLNRNTLLSLFAAVAVAVLVTVAVFVGRSETYDSCMDQALSRPTEIGVQKSMARCQQVYVTKPERERVATVKAEALHRWRTTVLPLVLTRPIGTVHASGIADGMNANPTDHTGRASCRNVMTTGAEHCLAWPIDSETCFVAATDQSGNVVSISAGYGYCAHSDNSSVDAAMAHLNGGFPQAHPMNSQ